MIVRQSAITKVIELSGRARVIGLARDTDFRAGQVVGISTVDVPSPRWYSIASGEVEADFEVLFTIVDEGALTPSLGRMAVGDRVTLHGPRGEFFDCEPGPGGSTYWIANGTGVAPFLSMAKSRVPTNRILVQGARTRDEAFGCDFFSRVLAGPGGGYTLCLSQANRDNLRDYEFDGRLTSYMRSVAPKPFDRFMLCGSVGMIIEAREILLSKGVKHEAITSEIYF